MMRLEGHIIILLTHIYMLVQHKYDLLEWYCILKYIYLSYQLLIERLELHVIVAFTYNL